MTINTRPVQFRDYLPEVYRTGEVGGVSVFSRFLKAFEGAFEELQAEIEGKADLTAGGIADLFSPDTTPPAEFSHRPQPGPGDFAFLAYLAGWLAVPLRADKPLDWNRTFFNAAIRLAAQRSTLPGIDAVLRAWLKGDVLETNPPSMVVTDFAPADPDATASFQLGVTSTLGVDSVLGDGPSFLFVADLTADPTLPQLSTPAGLDTLQRAARFILDAEKPAHTYYQLRLGAGTMQLAPPGQTVIDGRPAAQIGQSTLLWGDPWVFNSD